MLNLNKRLVSTELANYIKEQTNKYLDKYSKKVHIEKNEYNQKENNIIFLLPFVSLFSFLAGYYSKRITT
jgi:hypothetical protein